MKTNCQQGEGANVPVIPRGGRLAAPSLTAARTTPLAQQLRLSPEISSRLVKALAPSAAPCLVLGRELPPQNLYLFIYFLNSALKSLQP